MEGEDVEASQIGKEMPMTDPTFFCVACVCADLTAGCGDPKGCKRHRRNQMIDRKILWSGM